MENLWPCYAMFKFANCKRLPEGICMVPRGPLDHPPCPRRLRLEAAKVKRQITLQDVVVFGRSPLVNYAQNDGKSPFNDA